MKKQSVSDQLLAYLQTNHGVFASGDLQRMEWRNSNNSLAVPRSVVRRLQELAEDDKIHCEMRGNHAHYSATPIAPVIVGASANSGTPYRVTHVLINGQRVAVSDL
jgi:hypothetical protein